jgi:hypothetical protein
LDGKGSWRDNVFVERWRTVKYEEVYLKVYESVAEARSSIGCYLKFYNSRRPHSALDRRTPDQAYYASLPRCVGSITRSPGSACKLTRAAPNPTAGVHLTTQNFCSKTRSHRSEREKEGLTVRGLERDKENNERKLLEWSRLDADGLQRSVETMFGFGHTAFHSREHHGEPHYRP